MRPLIAVALTSICLLMLALMLATSIGAQIENIEKQADFAVTRSATIDHPLLVLPRRSIEGFVDADGWRLSAIDEEEFRVYRASRGERVHTAKVAFSSHERLAFNPATSRFERLSHNLRVELRDPDALDQIVDTAGGTGGKAYPLLGFALVYLAAEIDPVKAADSIREMPAVSNVRLTVRGPKRVPR